LKTARIINTGAHWTNRRFRVVYDDPEHGRRASGLISFPEAVSLARRFNHELRRRMKTQRTIQ